MKLIIKDSANSFIISDSMHYHKVLQERERLGFRNVGIDKVPTHDEIKNLPIFAGGKFVYKTEPKVIWEVEEITIEWLDGYYFNAFCSNGKEYRCIPFYNRNCINPHIIRDIDNFKNKTTIRNRKNEKSDL